MAITTYSITYSDVDDALDGYSSASLSTEILAVITRKASRVNAKVRQLGIDPAAITSASDQTAYEYIREVIILLSAAEVARRFTHQDPDLSKQRASEAEEMLRFMRDCPEAVFESWDANENLGTVRTSSQVTERSPGSVTFPRRRRGLGWGPGVKF